MSIRAQLAATFLVALTLASLLALVPTNPVASQGGGAWPCDGTPILMRGGKFHRIVPDPAVPGNLTIDTVAGTSGIWNSTGFDPTNNLIYGVGKIGGIKTVRAYDSAGDVAFQTPIQDPYPHAAGTYAGTVLGDGRYIIHSVGNGSGVGWYAGARFNLWSMNPATGASTHIGSTPVNFADFSYNPLDGFLYQIVNRKLYKVDPNTGATTTSSMPGTFPNGSFGASWFDAAGNLYSFRNNPGDIFKVDPNNRAGWSEVGEVGADGGNCISQIDLKKDVVDSAGDPVAPADRVYNAGSTVTYKFTLINNGVPTQNRTVDLCDVLPADGRSYTGVWSSTNPAATMSSGGASGDTAFCKTPPPARPTPSRSTTRSSCRSPVHCPTGRKRLPTSSPSPPSMARAATSHLCCPRTRCAPQCSSPGRAGNSIADPAEPTARTMASTTRCSADRTHLPLRTVEPWRRWS